jgi:hypothetical protein
VVTVVPAAVPVVTMATAVPVVLVVSVVLEAVEYRAM